ncbi:hypothetical protein FACS1894159_09920 [Bacteroidia bacterium]|nr:hypothetical protein FACS1894159_09920 [Bacteroidia bacterium]
MAFIFSCFFGLEEAGSPQPHSALAGRRTATLSPLAQKDIPPPSAGHLDFDPTLFNQPCKYTMG